ncbi:MAG: rod shape-determining protein MreC, partial [Opitutaceae bacterium]|nr:rod shape-determining protein MreC [Opitutaceae bacterium]
CVARVERQAETSFARIELAPVASADGRRHVLVLPIKPRSVLQFLSLFHRAEC